MSKDLKKDVTEALEGLIPLWLDYGNGRCDKCPALGECSTQKRIEQYGHRDPDDDSIDCFNGTEECYQGFFKHAWKVRYWQESGDWYSEDHVYEKRSEEMAKALGNFYDVKYNIPADCEHCPARESYCDEGDKMSCDFRLFYWGYDNYFMSHNLFWPERRFPRRNKGIL